MESSFNPAADVVAFSGLQTRIEVPASDVGGRVCVLEISVAPGKGAPLHISHDEDKYFRVLRGQFDFRIGDEQRVAVAGATITVARGVGHAFTNTANAQGVLLLVSTPGGHDAFFRDMAKLRTPHDPIEVVKTMGRHGQSLADLTD